jgi:hypothetical protein
MLRKLVFAALLIPVAASAQEVTIENFVRAETDTYFRGITKSFGAGVGELIHLREPITVKNQHVIRQNQDTLYSGVLLDLSEPAKVTLPETGGRYQSMHVINQDHYMFVERFAMVNFRTFADPSDTKDVKKAQAAQDGIKLGGGGSGPFNAPDWDKEALAVARKALSDLATLGFNSRYAYGRKDEVRPVDFLVGAAAGWAGLPASAAMYVVDSVDENDDKTTYSLTAKDVPVDAFWSITVYNADGYLEANDLGVNSYNNFTAEPNEDGSHTIHFGACDGDRLNCIPITPGWNYVVRMYEPHERILNGSWTFPTPEPEG